MSQVVGTRTKANKPEQLGSNLRKELLGLVISWISEITDDSHHIMLYNEDLFIQFILSRVRLRLPYSNILLTSKFYSELMMISNKGCREKKSFRLAGLEWFFGLRACQLRQMQNKSSYSPSMVSVAQTHFHMLRMMNRGASQCLALSDGQEFVSRALEAALHRLSEVADPQQIFSIAKIEQAIKSEVETVFQKKLEECSRIYKPSSDDRSRVLIGNSGQLRLRDIDQLSLKDAGQLLIGGSNPSPLGGSNHSPPGGSNHSPLGGSNHSPLGGSNHSPLGGRNHLQLGGSNYSHHGGSNQSPLGGSSQSPLKGSSHSHLGGSSQSHLGGRSVTIHKISAPLLHKNTGPSLLKYLFDNGSQSETSCVQPANMSTMLAAEASIPPVGNPVRGQTGQDGQQARTTQLVPRPNAGQETAAGRVSPIPRPSVIQTRPQPVVLDVRVPDRKNTASALSPRPDSSLSSASNIAASAIDFSTDPLAVSGLEPVPVPGDLWSLAECPVADCNVAPFPGHDGILLLQRHLADDHFDICFGTGAPKNKKPSECCIECGERRAWFIGQKKRRYADFMCSFIRRLLTSLLCGIEKYTVCPFCRQRSMRKYTARHVQQSFKKILTILSVIFFRYM